MSKRKSQKEKFKKEKFKKEKFKKEKLDPIQLKFYMDFEVSVSQFRELLNQLKEVTRSVSINIESSLHEKSPEKRTSITSEDWYTPVPVEKRRNYSPLVDVEQMGFAQSDIELLPESFK
jgi:hypothetical protein